jgi:hypothetical protein
MGGDMRRVLSVADFRELCLKEPYPYIGLISHDLALREQNKDLLVALVETRHNIATNMGLRNEYQELDATIEMLDAAIAKAKGEVNP